MSLSSKRKKHEEKQNKGDGDRLSKTTNTLWEFQKKKEEESLFEEIITQNFPKWRKDVDIQILRSLKNSKDKPKQTHTKKHCNQTVERQNQIPKSSNRKANH